MDARFIPEAETFCYQSVAEAGHPESAQGVKSPDRFS